jgi:hypothetical protein
MGLRVSRRDNGRHRGHLAALDAGFGIAIFPKYGLPETLKALGSADNIITPLAGPGIEDVSSW